MVVMKTLNATPWIACAAVLFSVAAVAGTQVYKWTDSQDVVHYSDKAPAHVNRSVKIIELPTLPPVNPQAVKQERAYITSVNQWYQRVINRQLQWRKQQLLAWRAGEPPQPVKPVSTTRVASLSPLCWDCGRLWRRRAYYWHRAHSRRQAKPRVFKSKIWSTQPNRFTQSLYHPQ